MLRTSSDVFIFNLGLYFERPFWEKNQPSIFTTCSDNTIRLLVLMADILYWGLQATSSFSIWSCVLKGHFERRTPQHVVTVPFACWFLWQADYIEDFKWRLHFQFGVVFWKAVLREVYFEGPNHVPRALETSILNTCFSPSETICSLSGIPYLKPT